MAVETTALARLVPRPRSQVGANVRRLLPALGLAGFVAALGYLVIVPLVRLEGLAFGHGARGYRVAYQAPGIANTIRTTIALAVGSLAIALVLGTLLGYAATRLSPRLRLLQA